MNQNSLGYAVFHDLEKNEYLVDLYSAVLYNYAIKLFGIEAEAKEYSLEDSLRFADLLSKSTGVDNSEQHHLLGQELIALLYELHPDDEDILYYMGSVLSNVGNFRGVSLRNENYKSDDLFENLVTEIRKDYLRIPAAPDKYFFSAQKEIYDKFDASYFSYSAPTSLGKSYVMRMFIKEQIEKDNLRNYAIVVPSKALINEVTASISDDLKDTLSEKDYRIVTSAGALALEEPHNYIFVMTPERLLYLLILMRDMPIEYLFIDEAHKISKKDGRSAFYYKIVDMLAQREQKPHIIFASPNIPNPEVYLQLIPGAEETANNNLATKYAPVNQEKFVIDLKDYKYHLYNEVTGQMQFLDRIPADKDLLCLVKELGSDKRTIVYCNSKDDVIELANEYADRYCRNDLGDPELDALAADIVNDVHGAYYLAKLIRKGVAYHMDYLPAHLRIRIEEIYKRPDGKIKTLFSTSTLLEGVNLPADNLFITSNKNGGVMSAIDFRNLMGRVGRIEFNLYGNVFLVCRPRKANLNEYLSLLQEKIAPQQLSIASGLTVEQKQKIVANLRSGNAELLIDAGQDPDQYQLMRRVSNILLKDVMSGRNSRVVQEFADCLSNEAGVEIRDAFARKGSLPDDNISLSHDQTENLENRIRRGLRYPQITIGGMAKHQDIIDFLEALCDIFKWEKYESGTLGYTRTDEYGRTSHTKLRWYAYMLNEWVSGKSLKQIITESIQHNLESGGRVYYKKHWVDFEYTHEHINALIASILETIEDSIQFRLSNYFLKFSEVYRVVHPDAAFKDWYEFVEYGATDPLIIWLQKNGFTREAATYLKANRAKYLIEIDEQTYLFEALLQCDNESIRREAQQVYFNNHELFMPDFLM